MNIFNKKYKYIIALLFIFIFEINNFATSQSMDESRRAMQQSKDIMSLSAENKICQNSCNSSFRSDALNNPSNANRIFDRCVSGCQENYQSKMSCIQSQLASQYSPSKCNKSFKSGSQNFNESNSSDGVSNFIWLLVFCIAGLFYFKRKYSERFSLNFSYIVTSKNKINNIFNIFYSRLIKLIFVIKNLITSSIIFIKKRKFLLLSIFLIPTSVTFIYSQINKSAEPEQEQSVKFLINPKFYFIAPFSNGLALVEEWEDPTEKYYIDTQGRKVFDLTSNFYGIFKDGLLEIGSLENLVDLRGFADTNGKTVIPLRFPNVLNFSEGLAAVQLPENNKWGFINKEGNLAIEAKFESIGSFNGGMAEAVIIESGERKTGFIDKNGDFMIPAQYDAAREFNGNLASVYNHGVKKWGFINKQGEIVIKYQFDVVENFSEGLAAVKVDGKWGFIDEKGEFIIKPNFIFARKEKNPILDIKFEEGLLAVFIGEKDTGKMGFIDKKGNVVIKPIYTEALNFSEGLAAVFIGDEVYGKWGFINKKGEFVIKPKFDGVTSFSEGFASVSSGGEYSSNGKFEAPTVIKGSKWGVIYHPNNKSN